MSGGEVERGILISGTGLGMAISANKFAGVRAAACADEVTAELSRRHNELNVLCLSGDMLSSRTPSGWWKFGWPPSSKAAATNAAWIKSANSNKEISNRTSPARHPVRTCFEIRQGDNTGCHWLCQCLYCQTLAAQTGFQHPQQTLAKPVAP